jgi:hypothetical protein
MFITYIIYIIMQDFTGSDCKWPQSLLLKSHISQLWKDCGVDICQHQHSAMGRRSYQHGQYRCPLRPPINDLELFGACTIDPLKWASFEK